MRHQSSCGGPCSVRVRSEGTQTVPHIWDFDVGQRFSCSVIGVALYDAFMCAVVLPCDLILAHPNFNRKEHFFLLNFHIFFTPSRGTIMAILLALNTSLLYVRICHPLQAKTLKANICKVVLFLLLLSAFCSMGTFFAYTHLYVSSVSKTPAAYRLLKCLFFAIFVVSSLAAIIMHILIFRELLKVHVLPRPNSWEARPSGVFVGLWRTRSVPLSSARRTAILRTIRSLFGISFLCVLDMTFYLLNLPLFLVLFGLLNMHFYVLALASCVHMLNPLVHISLSWKVHEAAVMRTRRILSTRLSSMLLSSMDSSPPNSIKHEDRKQSNEPQTAAGESSSPPEV
ncbi:unnamed protein product [Dibothriocephalus latus]|uniref:G-protein coupled receptors family 1 profile domain-containing protein n=1 Tax=Dibothriocephalus latus TaxID=60516 RepID=A0A3P7NQ48_DIBLA|nr:unnamed protein product [Dibothriocephalus latus]